MTQTFEAPASQTESVRPADLLGHLLIITPREYRTGINTSLGVAEAIEVDLVDLDTNTEHNSVLFFNIALRGSLRGKIGERVLARMGQGIATPGKSAPWILLAANQDTEAISKATNYLAGKLQAPAPAVASVNSAEVQLLLEKLGAKPF